MISAFTKGDNKDLCERYMVTCASCKYERQMFGTEPQVRAEALRMGWEMRHKVGVAAGSAIKPERMPVPFKDLVTEDAYCPHCKTLVKPTVDQIPCPS